MQTIVIEIKCDNRITEEEIQEILCEYITQKDSKFDCMIRNESHIHLGGRDKNGRLKSVRQDSIIYIEKNGHKSIVYTTGGTIETYLSLRELTGLLSSQRFFKVHQGYIVNISRIKALYATELTLMYIDRRIPVSRRNRHFLESSISEKN